LTKKMKKEEEGIKRNRIEKKMSKEKEEKK
jgi:hypothetical protein